MIAASKKTVPLPRRLLGAVGAVIVIGGSVTAALALGAGRSGPIQSDAPNAGVSNEGAIVVTGQLTDRDRSIVESTGGQGAIKELGSARGLSFFRIDNPDGSSCFAVGPTTGDHAIGSVECPDPNQADQSFPSHAVPIEDFSPVVVDLQTHVKQFTRLSGIAEDGIAAVGLEEKDGTLVKVPVTNNIYALLSLPQTVPSALVAFDAAGKVVFRQIVNN